MADQKEPCKVTCLSVFLSITYQKVPCTQKRGENLLVFRYCQPKRAFYLKKRPNFAVISGSADQKEPCTLKKWPIFAVFLGIANQKEPCT